MTVPCNDICNKPAPTIISLICIRIQSWCIYFHNK